MGESSNTNCSYTLMLLLLLKISTLPLFKNNQWLYTMTAWEEEEEEENTITFRLKCIVIAYNNAQLLNSRLSLYPLLFLLLILRTTVHGVCCWKVQLILPLDLTYQLAAQPAYLFLRASSALDKHKLDILSKSCLSFTYDHCTRSVNMMQRFNCSCK